MVEFEVLNVTVYCHQFKMFTLIDGKGSCVLLYMCIHSYMWVTPVFRVHSESV